MQRQFNLPGHSGFLNDVSVTPTDKMSPRILLNEKITGFTHLNQSTNGT